jgi:quinol monooxygenase YgiN
MALIFSLKPYFLCVLGALCGLIFTLFSGESAMAIYKTAHFIVKPEGLAQAQQAIGEFVAYIKDHEPGTCLYTAMHQAQDSTSFLHHFIFEDTVAEEIHRTSAAVKHFTGILYPLLASEVVFTDYH